MYKIQTHTNFINLAKLPRLSNLEFRWIRYAPIKFVHVTILYEFPQYLNI